MTIKWADLKLKKYMSKTYNEQFTLHHSEARASELGCTMVLPKDNELFIDIDTHEDHRVFQRNFIKLEDAGLVLDYKETLSKSGMPHRHIIVTLTRPVKNTEERILLQLLLGSDQKHEMWCYLANLNGHPNPVALFERKP